MSTIKERLLQYIEATKTRKSYFEKKCGFCNGYINNIVNSISPAKVAVIKENYPDLNVGWLMTGEGNMLNTTNEDAATIEELKKTIAEKDRTIIALTHELEKYQNSEKQP